MDLKTYRKHVYAYLEMQALLMVEPSLDIRDQLGRVGTAHSSLMAHHEKDMAVNDYKICISSWKEDKRLNLPGSIRRQGVLYWQKEIKALEKQILIISDGNNLRAWSYVPGNSSDFLYIKEEK